MEDLVFRSIKSIVLFGVMYLSLKFLGVANGAAVIVSFIPLVLGMVNVMTGTAFSIAALVFILAAFSALLPAKYNNAVDFGEQVFSGASLERGLNREAAVVKNTKQNDKPNKASEAPFDAKK